MRADVKKILQDVKEGEFDDMANLLDGDIKDVANDMKDAAGVDDIKRDVESVQGKEAKPKASAKKAAAKPKSAKKTSAKKKKPPLSQRRRPRHDGTPYRPNGRPIR